MLGESDDELETQQPERYIAAAGIAANAAAPAPGNTKSLLSGIAEQAPRMYVQGLCLKRLFWQVSAG